MRIGERVQQDAVDHGEQSGVCADGKRQREDRDSREPRRFCQHANGVTKILEQFAHDSSGVPDSERRCQDFVSGGTYCAPASTSAPKVQAWDASDLNPDLFSIRLRKSAEPARVSVPLKPNGGRSELAGCLLIAQGDDWIYAHCAARGNVACG